MTIRFFRKSSVHHLYSIRFLSSSDRMIQHYKVFYSELLIKISMIDNLSEIRPLPMPTGRCGQSASHLLLHLDTPSTHANWTMWSISITSDRQHVRDTPTTHANWTMWSISTTSASSLRYAHYPCQLDDVINQHHTCFFT